VSELVTKLLAAIEAKEAKARTAIPGPWRVERETGDVTPYWNVVTDEGYLMADSDSEESPNAHFIAHNDPASVLRMCSAHRDIVEHAQSALDLVDEEGWVITDGEVHIDRDTYEAVEDAADIWTLTLALLADAYGIEEGS
jgi:Family of unknown function (DUF6221)